ncbi:MAG: hypothetical protein HF978_01575 [Desulfobacteraceae bacterium]|nr:hypothetical protein [Desulfobacteraceae bacterium]MBC2754215.1 hypothetical protein [Desulfobacteraceae bacterium]
MTIRSVSKGATLIAVLIVFTAFFTGCESGSGFMKGQSTDVGVSLSCKNYRIIEVAAQGESTGFFLFGFIPIMSPSFSEAKIQLYKSVSVPLEGKAIALVNQTEDKSFRYFILFSIPKIILNADIIEYVE